MDISEPASGSSHLAEKLYLLHGQPGGTVQEIGSARFHRRVNGVKTKRRASATIPWLLCMFPAPVPRVQTSPNKTCHAGLSLSQY